jgi:hypothetical protein
VGREQALGAAVGHDVAVSTSYFGRFSQLVHLLKGIGFMAAAASRLGR